MFSKSILSLILILNFLIINSDCLYIGDNFQAYLNFSCSYNQVSLLLSDNIEESTVVSQWRSLHCNKYKLLDNKESNQQIIKNLDIFDKRDLNFFIEYTNETILLNVLNILYNSVNSKIINIFIVIKSDFFREFSSNILNTYSGLRCAIINVKNYRNATDIAYIRPVIKGCQSYEGILYANDPGVKDVLTVKPLKCNLNATVLRVVVNEALPYCSVFFKNGEYVLGESVEGLMIDILAKKFNFRYKVIYANQSWGTVENGVWIGSVGHLYDKRADIAICDLTKSIKRTEVVDYTQPYSVVPLTFVTLRPGLKPRKWITMRPFTRHIWILIIISFILIATMIQIFYVNAFYMKYTPTVYNRMSSISLALVGALLHQSNVQIRVKGFNKIRFLLILWFLSSLILMKTYGGVFYSVLTLPEYEDPIENLSDLEKVAVNREYDIFTYRHSYYYDYFTNAECCDAYYQIGQSLIESKIDIPSDLKAGIEAVQQSRHLPRNKILIMTYQGLAFGVRSFASIDMHISTDTLMIDQIAMGVQKGSPLLNAMNEAIIQFFENGLFLKWMTNTLIHIPAHPHKDEADANGKKSFSLSDFQSIFYISFIGVLLSNIVFICELILNYKRK